MADVNAAAQASCEAAIDQLVLLDLAHLPPLDGATAALVADIQIYGVAGAKQRACGNVALPVHPMPLPASLLNPAPLAPELDPAFNPAPGVAPEVGASRPSGVDYDQVKRDEEEKRGGGGAGVLVLLVLLMLAGRK